MRNNETQLQYTQLTTHAFTGGDASFSGNISIGDTGYLTGGVSTQDRIGFTSGSLDLKARGNATIDIDSNNADTNRTFKVTHNGGTSLLSINETATATFSGTVITTHAKADLVSTGNGTVGAPSYTFKNDTDTGFYLGQNDAINVANAGSNEFLFEADGDFHADGDVIDFQQVLVLIKD